MKFRFIYLASFLLTIFLVNVNQSHVYTRSNGTIVSKTNAPDEPTCAQCHGGSSGGSGSVDILIDGSTTPPVNYVAGQTYSITVEVEDPASSEYGFQMTYLNESNTGPTTGRINSYFRHLASDQQQPRIHHPQYTKNNCHKHRNGKLGF